MPYPTALIGASIMALQFIIRINRKAPARIGVLKTVIGEGKIIEKENLGTLKILDEKTLEKFGEEHRLNDQERYQLENYVANLTFNKNEFKTEPEDLKREFMNFSPDYEKALLTLWKQAKEYNIAFCPAEIQHNALLHKAKAVERKLNELTGSSIAILEGIGVDIRRYDTDNFKKRVDKTSKQLFGLIIAMDQPLNQICDEFKEIAINRYHKNANLKPHYFKEYAESVKRLPLWYSTVAIDLLMQHGVNPLQSIPAAKVAEHWARMRKEKLSFDEACAAFKAEFKPSKEHDTSIFHAIKLQYTHGLST
jgi:hypothetical protein